MGQPFLMHDTNSTILSLLTTTGYATSRPLCRCHGRSSGVLPRRGLLIMGTRRWNELLAVESSEVSTAKPAGRILECPVTRLQVSPVGATKILQVSQLACSVTAEARRLEVIPMFRLLPCWSVSPVGSFPFLPVHRLPVHRRPVHRLLFHRHHGGSEWQASHSRHQSHHSQSTLIPAVGQQAGASAPFALWFGPAPRRRGSGGGGPGEEQRPW